MTWDKRTHSARRKEQIQKDIKRQKKKCSRVACPNGEKLQPFENFHNLSHSADGKYSMCKDCVKLYRQTKAFKESQRKYRRYVAEENFYAKEALKNELSAWEL